MIVIATVSTSLKMLDMMTRPLQQVTQALNLTISAMDRMSNSANRDIKTANTLNAAREAAQKASASLNQLAVSQDKAANNQNKLNNSFQQGLKTTDGLHGKIKGLLATYLGFQAVKQGLNATVGGAMRAQQQLFTIQGIMGNQEVGKAYFENLRNQANQSTFAFEEFANNARKFMQFTKNTDSLDKLRGLSERLTLIDPTQGLEGAGFAMKEAMSGDFQSLRERFGFGKADAEILKGAKSMDEFISKFDKLLSKKGFTEQMLQQYNKSASAQFNNLKSNFRTALANTGSGALEALMPIISRLNQSFNSGEFQSFFDGVTKGLNTVARITVFVINIFSRVGAVVKNNWSWIAPIIDGIVTALIAYKTIALIVSVVEGISAVVKGIHAAHTMLQTKATLGATAAQHGLNFALLACPLVWIILIIVAVIVAIVAWSVHTNGLKATWLIFTDTLLTAWDSIKINCVLLANIIMNCWDWIEIASMKLNIGVQNAFGNMKVGALMMIEDMVNGAIDMINKLIEFANKIPGVSIDMISNVTFAAKANLDNEASKKSRGDMLANYIAEKDAAKHERENKAKIMEAKALVDHKERLANIEAAKAASKNKGNIKDELLKGLDLDKWNKDNGPGDLAMDNNKHLKNIDDKIDVGNEHLEALKDLAEIESIQNFVTLTPTVQVTTGDIREEADISMIISQIEDYMQNELTNSVEGVYANV